MPASSLPSFSLSNANCPINNPPPYPPALSCLQWLGEPEKSVKAIFSVASKLSPCVVFIDEVDSLLSKRGQDSEHEAMRKVRGQDSEHEAMRKVRGKECLGGGETREGGAVAVCLLGLDCLEGQGVVQQFVRKWIIRQLLRHGVLLRDGFMRCLVTSFVAALSFVLPRRVPG